MKDTYNIIFLDTNGVLNYYLHRQKQLKKRKSIDYKTMELCNIALRNVGKLCKETKSKIVITSSWRRDKERGYFKNLVNQLKGISQVEIIGETPVLGYEIDKKAEINSWLEEHRDMDYNKYIIIDDNEVSDDIEKLVLCNSEVGFTTKSLYEEAYQKLMN